MPAFVYLLLGTNAGDKIRNLQFAREKLAGLGEVITCSSVYESAAWGKEDQENFLNQVCLIHTAERPHAVLATALTIEKAMGRERKEKWGSRVLDIDILFYNDEVIDEPELRIPHPEIANRRFTLEPLNEIAPRLVHPLLQRDIATLLKTCSDPLWVKKHRVG